jgi:hypothetical protein
MRYMEIALLPKDSLKIKGKHATFIVDSMDKSICEGVIVLNKTQDQLSIQDGVVVIDGPGEYEIGGVKISGIRSEGEVVYNLNVEGVEILLGRLSSLEKQQHKLKEQDIVVAYVDSMTNASFVTSLASSVVIFYGEQAKAQVEKFGKGNVLTVQKYSGIAGKLPQEVETVILE